MKTPKPFLALILALGLRLPIVAAPFDEETVVPQPDGTEITLRIQGDEFYFVYETTDGYTVTQDRQTGCFHYASLSSEGDELIPSGPRVGSGGSPGPDVPKHLRIHEEARARRILDGRNEWDHEMRGWRETLEAFHDTSVAQATAESEAETSSQPQSEPIAPTSIVALTILVDFSDAPATVPTATIENLLNSPTGTSVRKYYFDNSNGLMTYTNIVTPYVRVARTKADYALIGQPDHNLKIDAVDALMALPNYHAEILPTLGNLTKLPNNHIFCNIFYAGGTGPMGAQTSAAAAQNLAENMVASGFTVQPIGSGTSMDTFAHESGHLVFGFPDLYDYNSTYKGAGVFCLMSSGGNLDPASQICAYLKAKAGWATITDITASSFLTATVGVQGSPRFNHFYRYRRPGVDTEYFIIENRQKQGQDAALPGRGVLIWHIDELGSNSRPSLSPNDKHNNYEASLEQADNLFHLQNEGANWGDDKDPYYLGNTAAAYTGIFDDFSAPSAKWWDGKPSGMYLGNFSGNGTDMTFQVGNPGPYVIGNDAVLVREGYAPANNVIDVGETVTVRFNVRNSGFSSSTNAVVTLLAQGGVGSPSGPQSLGSLTAQTDAQVDFTFTASAALGEKISAVIQIVEGAKVYGSFANTFTLGKIDDSVWTQNFDNVTAPSLPSGWTTNATGGTTTLWKTSTASSDTSPNSAFLKEVNGYNASVELTSPVVSIAHPSTQLRFRHNYNTERDGGGIYAGGVLEIKIGSDPWQDIVNAGGSWETNGYNVPSIDPYWGNPLAFRSVWGGYSGGFITTLVNLPPGTVGQNVQFRWLYGYDSWAPYGGSVGWYVDTVSLIGPILVSPVLETSPRTHDFGLTGIGQSKTMSFTATNTSTQSVSGTISASPPFSVVGGASFNLGAGQATSVTVAFTPGAAGTFTGSLIFNSTGKSTVSPILTGIGTAISNNPPIANAQNLSTPQDTAKAITLTGTDPDGNPLGYSIVTPPLNGNLSGTPPAIIYTPTAGYSGVDSFTFKVNDGTLDSSAATVSINVTPDNGWIPWTPARLNLLAWYDANDVATITSSGGAVSQWNDKSGNGHHATQTNSTLMPAFATGEILFGTNNRYLNIPRMSADAYSILMVLKNNSTITGSSAAQMPLSIEALSSGPAFGSATGVFTNEILSMFDEDTNAVFLDRQSASGTQIPSLSNSPHTYSFVLDGNWHIGVDGSINKRDLTSGSRHPFLISQQVGALGTNIRKRASDNVVEHSWTGLMHEMVLVSTALSLDDRRKMEGYFAHKWDAVNGNNALVGALPVDHPWKSSAPGNYRPTALSQTVSVQQNQPANITLTGTDADGDPLVFVVVAAPANGSLTGTPPALTYTPSSNFSGTDTFRFKTSDGIADSYEAIVTLDVAPSMWTPGQLDLMAWYDASDTDSVIVSSGKVSIWNDKSGNNRHVSQSVATQQPAISGSTISFDGSNDFLMHDAAFMYAAGSVDVYVVGAVSPDGDRRLVSENNSNNTTPLYNMAQTHQSNGSMISSFIRNDAGSIRFSNSSQLSPAGSFSRSVRGLYQWRDSGTQISGRVAGGSPAGVNYTRSGVLTVNRFTLGAIGPRSSSSTAGSMFVNAGLNEIIVCPVLSDTDRQKLEGYLAHKWDDILGGSVLVGALPVGHPWKSSVPSAISSIGYAAWSAGFGGYDLGKPSADADADGMSNFQEFAFGTDPIGGADSKALVTPVDPLLNKYRYQRYSHSGLAYAVEVSGDLRNWTEVEVVQETIVSTTERNVQTVEVAFSPPSFPSGMFIRIRASSD